ncbi:S41 family peptidase [Paracnuella aquatica]|uniref:S41 family peptidase n=1 Tax=Paracnuella aquatica TaxID=2268757 RepID=UPI00138FA10A|nr:S41 family peptidase [Paracnuella aquatica]
MKFTFAPFLFLLFFSCSTARHASRRFDATKDFEAFWQSFQQRYALFDIKGVQWDSAYKQFRPAVTAQTNVSELVEILGKMVAPLRDRHITISKGDEVLYRGSRNSAFRELMRGREAQFWNMVDQNLNRSGFGAINGVGPKYKEEALFYTGAAPDAAYIRITRCFGAVASLYSDEAEAKDLAEMLRLWDSLLVAYGPKQKLIIDLRGNGGGHGGREMASRLLAAPTVTHSIALRDSAGGFGPAAPQLLAPHSGVRFLKNVVLITSDRTASSAEDFALSLVQQPHVQRVGMPTAGMFSDMYNLTLPSGLEVTFSHQLYLDTNGQPLEDKGVPVQVQVANTAADVENGTDPVLQKALAL